MERKEEHTHGGTVFHCSTSLPTFPPPPVSPNFYSHSPNLYPSLLIPIYRLFQPLLPLFKPLSPLSPSCIPPLTQTHSNLYFSSLPILVPPSSTSLPAVHSPLSQHLSALILPTSIPLCPKLFYLVLRFIFISPQSSIYSSGPYLAELQQGADLMGIGNIFLTISSQASYLTSHIHSWLVRIAHDGGWYCLLCSLSLYSISSQVLAQSLTFFSVNLL